MRIQQADGLPGKRVDLGCLDLAQQLGQFGKGDVRVMPGCRGVGGDHVQVGRGVCLDNALGQAEAEYLAQPLAGFLGDVVRAA